MKNVKKFKDLTDLSAFAAKQIISVGKRAIKKNDRFTLVLAGGSTPKLLYQLLKTDEYKKQLDWQKVIFFLGDERDVSPMSDQSNFRMISENLLEALKIPNSNILRWNTEIIKAEEVAENYEKTIKRFFGLQNGEFPQFDMVLLGMGDDGHTASLFPATPALHETKRIAVNNWVEKYDANRLTLTYPAINNAGNILFLVSGEEKAEAVREVLKGASNFEKFPSQKIKPVKGKLLWLIDKGASSEL
ncbi:MAG: 6-phosphogluconolactonase [Pyrinomonadaceae bacterium]|nr:6-phosphogluconolactonase [Pyrinomonadaceae bacterium]